MMVIRYEYQLFADYFQFYLQDDDMGLGDLSNAWTEDALKLMLAVGPGVIGVATARNMKVPVVVDVLDVEPDRDLKGWDHVVEAGIEVRTGRIVVAGCTDYFPDAARVPVRPGIYRARISFSGLESISANGLEGDDHYRVQLWPTALPADITVLKSSALPYWQRD